MPSFPRLALGSNLSYTSIGVSELYSKAVLLNHRVMLHRMTNVMRMVTIVLDIVTVMTTFGT